MNIASALKLRARLAGKLQRLYNLMAQNYAYLEDGSTLEDAEREALDGDIQKIRKTLTRLKTAITVANTGAAQILTELAEAKAHLVHLNSLPTHMVVRTSYGPNAEEHTHPYRHIITPSVVRYRIVQTQEEIDRLQDAIDAYNAVTEVNFSMEGE